MDRKLLMIVFLVLLLKIFTKGCEGLDRTRTELMCKLSWDPSEPGTKLPENPVSAFETNIYIARGKDEKGRYSVGFYNRKKDRAIFPFPNDNTTATYLSSYELLTNPHSCILEWHQKFDAIIPDFAVPVDLFEIPSNYIGRVYANDSWISGTVILNKSQIDVPFEDETASFNMYQVLISYSKGLRLTVTELRLQDEPVDDQMDFIGIETLMNDGDSIIVQKVEHNKNFTQTVSLTTTKETTASKTESSGWDVIVAGNELKVEHTYKESVTETFTTTKQTEIILERWVTVPPFTSVLVCSTITFKENLLLTFTAKGVYSIPSFTPEEVLSILETENITGATIVGSEVVLPISGEFQGSFSMSSQIIAVSIDEPDGCQIIEKRFEKRIEMANMQNSLA